MSSGESKRPGNDDPSPNKGSPCPISPQFLGHIEVLAKDLTWPGLEAATAGAITQPKVNAWRDGKQPRAGALALICRYLECEPGFLDLPEKTCTEVTKIMKRWHIQASGQGKLAEIYGRYVAPIDAPDAPKLFVGRVALLQRLDRAWTSESPRLFVIGGIGGEGKSSLARHWIDRLAAGKPSLRPREVFWWEFDNTSNTVGDFFDSLLRRLERHFPSKPSTAPPQTRTELRERVLSLMKGMRILLVLDGFEVCQKPQKGTIEDTDLALFLQGLLEPPQASFCIITSRLRVAGLPETSAVIHEWVTGLDPVEGCQLLRSLLSQEEDDSTLERISLAFDGHAWTLDLFGKTERRRLEKGPADAPRHTGGPSREAAAASGILGLDATSLLGPDHKSFLEFYSGLLTPSESTLLKLIAAVRPPIEGADFLELLDRLAKAGPIGIELRNPPEVLKGLEEQGLLKSRASVAGRGRRYWVHALIRDFFSREDRDDPQPEPRDEPRTESLRLTPLGLAADLSRRWHGLLCDHYERQALPIPAHPRPSDLRGHIEALHHACRARDYDRAWTIAWDKLSQREKFVITTQLCAYDLVYESLIEFYEGRDIARPLLVHAPEQQSLVLRATGLSLRSLGRLRGASRAYRRVLRAYLEHGNARDASVVAQAMAELSSYLGRFDSGLRWARLGLRLAESAGMPLLRRAAHGHLGYILHMIGSNARSAEAFDSARALDGSRIPQFDYYYTLPCLWHAEHLRWAGRADEARRALDLVREVCADTPFPDDLSRYHRLLGDLESDAGRDDRADDHYKQSYDIAKKIKRRDIHIEALLALGRWYARRGEPARGRVLLREAMPYALAGPFRPLTADLNVALGWSLLASSDREGAAGAAREGRELAAHLGYHWGLVDAEELRSQV